MFYKAPKKSIKAERLVKHEHREIAKECLKALNSTYSLDLLHYLETGEHDSIQKPNPDDYCLPNAYRLDMQAYAIIGKNALFCEEEHLLPALIEGFFSQEDKNRLTNQRFSYATHDPLLDRVRNNVYKILKTSPPGVRLYGERHLVDSIRFGPGSSYFAKGDLVNPMDKIRNGKVSLTTGAVTMWQSYTGKTPFTNKEPLVVEPDFFGFVPKNFKSLRTISIGNDGNTLLQLSHGKSMRQRLKRFYDLNLQHELHKKIVKSSSVSRKYATVDIKNASNSVCTRVVKSLLPPIWYDLLDKSRHRKTLIGNYVHDLELFSAMGNGFTFELETIIFLAIAMTLPHSQILTDKGGDISVFGDDIICRDEDYDLLVERLTHFGFEVNRDKSFSGESWFRESCGADYFAGADVTPIYLRGEVDIHNLQTLYVVPNKIRQMSLSLYGQPPEVTRFARAYARSLRVIPQQWRIYGPALDVDELDRVEFPHGWLHKHPTRTRHKQVLYTLCFLPNPVKKLIYDQDGKQKYNDEDTLAYALHGNPSSGSVLRGRVNGGRFKKIVCYG